MKINFAHVIFVGDDPKKVSWIPGALIRDYHGGHLVSWHGAAKLETLVNQICKTETN